MYASGKGVPQDYVYAYAWGHLAAAGGFEIASRFKAELSKSMTRAQLAEGEQLSRALLARIERGESTATIRRPPVAASWALDSVAFGQKLIIYALAAYPLLPLIGLHGLVSSGLILVVQSVVFFVGALNICSGLGDGRSVTFIYLQLVLIPVVNLIVMLILNRRATRALRDAGCAVGFFGVRL
jgi:hypothetical protein